MSGQTRDWSAWYAVGRADGEAGRHRLAPLWADRLVRHAWVNRYWQGWRTNDGQRRLRGAPEGAKVGV